jgi:outer membrane biosynthesis protein TonB
MTTDNIKQPTPEKPVETGKPLETVAPVEAKKPEVAKKPEEKPEEAIKPEEKPEEAIKPEEKPVETKEEEKKTEDAEKPQEDAETEQDISEKKKVENANLECMLFPTYGSQVINTDGQKEWKMNIAGWTYAISNTSRLDSWLLGIISNVVYFFFLNTKSDFPK